MGKENQPVTSTEKAPLSINFGMATARRENPPKGINEDAVNSRETFDITGQRTAIVFILGDAVSQSGIALIGIESNGIHTVIEDPQAYVASVNTTQGLPEYLEEMELFTKETVRRALIKVNKDHVTKCVEIDQAQERNPEYNFPVYSVNGIPLSTLTALIIPDSGVRDSRGRKLKRSNAIAINVGDSRMFVAHTNNGKLDEIFKGLYDSQGRFVTLAIGMYSEDEFLSRLEPLDNHIKLLHLSPGDRIYLTSDGINREIIEEIEKNYHEVNPQERANLAIQIQRRRYGLLDDASIFVIEIGE